MRSAVIREGVVCGDLAVAVAAGGAFRGKRTTSPHSRSCSSLMHNLWITVAVAAYGELFQISIGHIGQFVSRCNATFSASNVLQFYNIQSKVCGMLAGV